MDIITSFLLSDVIMYTLLGLTFIIIVIWFHNKDASPENDLHLIDLFIGDDKKLSLDRIIKFFTWIVTTWGFLYLIVQSALTETYLLIYTGIWVSNGIIDILKTRKSS
jgi:hypothetical protein